MHGRASGQDYILNLARLRIPPLSRAAIITNQEGLINSRRRATKARGANRDRGMAEGGDFHADRREKTR